MKSVILTVGLLLAATSGFSQAAHTGQESSPASGARGISSSSTETAQILLACINQPKFEKYYAANGKAAVNVISLSDIQLSPKATALGRSVSSQKLDEAHKGSLSNYFFVSKVKTENDQVKVSLTYFYNRTITGYKTVMVDMDLVKKGEQYQIVNSNFKGGL